MRENRPYGSEGGEGPSLSRPLSAFWQETDSIEFISGQPLRPDPFEVALVQADAVHRFNAETDPAVRHLVAARSSETT
jgi:hypothetical protein